MARAEVSRPLGPAMTVEGAPVAADSAGTDRRRTAPVLPAAPFPASGAAGIGVTCIPREHPAVGHARTGDFCCKWCGERDRRSRSVVMHHEYGWSLLAEDELGVVLVLLLVVDAVVLADELAR